MLRGRSRSRKPSSKNSPPQEKRSLLPRVLLEAVISQLRAVLDLAPDTQRLQQAHAISIPGRSRLRRRSPRNFGDDFHCPKLSGRHRHSLHSDGATAFTVFYLSRIFARPFPLLAGDHRIWQYLFWRVLGRLEPFELRIAFAVQEHPAVRL